jgi:Na+/H+ antiporter NhaD/arsenite permease-like protein
MNALRQAGMSLGIALLGSLMGQRAVQQFTASAQAAGQQRLVAQARELILHPGSMHTTPQVLAWYRSAMASGFGWAMAAAGALALLVALGLYRQRAPA